MVSPLTQRLSSRFIRDLASECGFGLAGVAAAGESPDFGRFRHWAERGLAGAMGYLTDHRADVRSTPENLLPGVRSIICVGLRYGGPEPYSTEFSDPERAWIARYAWGEDYHLTLRQKLEQLARKMLEVQDFRWRACVDTAPLLERSLARQAGLGWIGRNTCLINQAQGSWFLLGEMLTTLDLEPDSPPPDRCGTCSRCIDACPTEAIVPSPAGGFELDARLCISYFTIELRSAVPETHRAAMGNNVFGCDICQDVCPWNRRTPVPEPRPLAEFQPPPLERLAGLTEQEFRQMFKDSSVLRAKYGGFLRNVAIAMGNSGLPKFRVPLARLAACGDPAIEEHARWALENLDKLKPPV